MRLGLAVSLFRASLCCFCVVASLVAPSGAAAEPMLWVARDADSTVYLFGTVHALKPGTSWLTPLVADAFARSSSLWIETDMEAREDRDPVAELGLAPGNPLSAQLDADTLEGLANLTLKLGIDYDDIDPMRPWLAAMTIGAAALRRDGYTAIGVDMALAREADVHGMEIAGFDETERPFQLFASLPPSSETRLLAAVVQDLAGAAPQHRRIVEAWLRGDEAELERIGLDEMKAVDPVLYETLIAARNRSWATRIDSLMLGRDVHFVAVGALHLVGPDRLQTILAAKGYAVERLHEAP